MSTTPLRPKIMFGLFFVLVMLSASFAVNSLTSPSIVAGAPSVDNSQPVTCVDPANSKTAEEKDEVTCTNGTVVVDYCLGSTAVLEYHIIPTSKQLTSTQMPCKAGTVCYDGACMFPNEAKALEKDADPTVQVSASCTDSDNGQNTEVSGTMDYLFKQGGWSYAHTFKDQCADSGSVLERYCDSGKGKNITLSCATGSSCSNGACVKSSIPAPSVSASSSVPGSIVDPAVETPVSCTDSDGGKNNLIAGSVNYAFTKGAQSYTVNLVDKCINDNVNVSENYCDSKNKAHTISLPCEAGSSCVSGACVKSSASSFPAPSVSASSSVPTSGSTNNNEQIIGNNVYSCVDSDGGKDNIFKAGTSIRYKNSSIDFTVQEVCVSETQVMEAHCDGINPVFSNPDGETCPENYVCKSGACINLSEPSVSEPVTSETTPPLTASASSSVSTNASKPTAKSIVPSGPSLVKPPTTSGPSTTKPTIPSLPSISSLPLTASSPSSVSSNASSSVTTTEAAPAEPLPAEIKTPFADKKIANCKKSGGESIYRKDKITWTAYIGSSVTPSVNEDTCTSDTRVAEWACASDSSPIIKYIDCPSGYSCSDGACLLNPRSAGEKPDASSVPSSVSTTASQPRPMANKSITPKSVTPSTASAPTARPRDSSVVSEETSDVSSTESSSVCRDNDGGLEYRIAGRVTCTDGLSFEDNCADSRILVEYYERGGEMKSTRVICSRVAEGYSCVRGACAKSDSVVPQSTATTPTARDVVSKGISQSVIPTVSSSVPPKAELRYECADSDGGMDIKTKGNTREALITEDGTRTEVAFQDACDGDMRVREYFCSGNRAKSKTMRCSMAEKCSDGICVRSSEVRETSSTTSSTTSSATSGSSTSRVSTSRDSSTRRGNVLTTWDTSPVDELVRRR
ncbi:MAG: hypothetical protein AABW86_00915 [Candidatus Micrarchaeota archaeon]